MTDQRCPDCEALITELDCLECVWHGMHENAVRVTEEKLAALPPATRTHCINGHAMTEENTRIDVRKPESGKPIYRVCITCHRQRAVEQKARNRAKAGLPPTPVEVSKTHCRHGHEMTVENTRTDAGTPVNGESMRCKTCHRKRRRERKARRRAEAIRDQA